MHFINRSITDEACIRDRPTPAGAPHAGGSFHLRGTIQRLLLRRRQNTEDATNRPVGKTSPVLLALPKS